MTYTDPSGARVMRSGRSLVMPTACDHDHLGRVLAMRHRVGVGYLFDVRERWKARIRRGRS